MVDLASGEESSISVSRNGSLVDLKRKDAFFIWLAVGSK